MKIYLFKAKISNALISQLPPAVKEDIPAKKMSQYYNVSTISFKFEREFKSKGVGNKLVIFKTTSHVCTLRTYSE